MKHKTIAILMASTVIPMAGTGCITVSIGGWSWGGTNVWTDPVTERIDLNAAELRAIEVKTHNGAITFDGQPAGTPEAYVRVTKKGGGSSLDQAQAALNAIEVFVEDAGAGTTRIGWKWAQPKRIGWGGSVRFDINAPGKIGLDATTHNGSVKATGISGDVSLLTHNGPITVDSGGGSLRARTHNGKVDATYDGESIVLKTHNGGVSADLTGCAAVGGSITTHNGGVVVLVGDQTSTGLDCRTHNGRIKCNAPLQSLEVSRRRLTGRLGTGDKQLDVETHNGSVRIEKSAG